MRAILLSTAIACSTSCTAQQTVPFSATEQLQRAAPATPAQAGPGTCSFADQNLPPDTIVVAAGAYQGRGTTFQIDQSGHQATQFDVGVHADKPVALLLAAYEPSVWNIGWTQGTKVVAVFATGYHRQAVAGLPKETPVIVSSYAPRGNCDYAYMGENLAWVNPKARRVFGKEAVRVYNKAPNGIIDIVETQRAKTAYATSPDVKPESFRDASMPLAGPAGLEDAVARGLIRPITAADMEMVRRHYQEQAAAATPSGKADIPPVAGASPSAGPAVAVPPVSSYRGFVVLKPFVYPAGLYGGNSASFVVPKGVPTPTGNPGHSTVIDLNQTVACAGPRCR